MDLRNIGRKSVSFLNNALTQAPRWADVWILIVFTIFITSNPYYLNNRINTYELSLYLPGINAIQHGLVPFRDFFHLRGPLELYMPTWAMALWGNHIQVLCGYFFFGNVFCLILVVLIARELIRSRYVFYMMIPAIIARTFPRVCFMNWGGMRYAFGLMAIYCVIRFFKNSRYGWMIAAGLLTACAVLTSLEIGICIGIAVIGSLSMAWFGKFLTRKEVGQGLMCFLAASLLGIAPWIIYSLAQHAFVPYCEALWTIITRFLIVINPHLASVYPSNAHEALAAMINPGNGNFKQLTPAYTYLFLLAYLIWCWTRGVWRATQTQVVLVGLFGFILYDMAFRALLASQFEMALMPEKIIYFFLIEVFILWMWEHRAKGPLWKAPVISVVLIVLFCFSLGYTMTRFNKRFWAYQFSSHVLVGKSIEPLKYGNRNEKYEQLTLERARGIWVPVDQAKELNQLNQFISEQTQRNDVVLMFPELGAYSFLFDRPFLGRFPMSDLSWLNDNWFEEYLGQLKQGGVKYIVVQKKMPEDWKKIYFGYAPNKMKYDQILSVIHASYAPVAQTEGSWIYERK